MPSDTSSVIVLPIKVAPASSSRCTAQAWRVGTGFCRAQSGLPPPVGWPATSKRSLAANVRPASGPFGAPGMRTLEPATKGLVTTGFYATIRVVARSGGGRRRLLLAGRSPLHCVAESLLSLGEMGFGL